MATPPDFTAGQVLTAAQMNAVGLWLVKTQTIGSAVTTVTVSDAFSADYENYRLVISGGAASAATYFDIQFGATTTGYYSSTATATFAAGAFDSSFVSNGAAISRIGSSSANGHHVVADIMNPFLAKTTSIQGALIQIATAGRAGSTGGFVNNTTSYTAFTLTLSGGANITGGTIFVYGYRI